MPCCSVEYELQYFNKHHTKGNFMEIFNNLLLGLVVVGALLAMGKYQFNKSAKSS